MGLNCKKSDPITVSVNELEDVEAFTYLGAMLDKQGGTEADIKRRLALARNAFATLQLLYGNHQSTALKQSSAFLIPVYSVGQRCGESLLQT